MSGDPLATDAVIVVMDIGKTNAKLCVIDATRAVLLHTHRCATSTDESGPYPHIDTDLIWHWYLEQLRELSQSVQVEQIVVTAHGATAALVNEKDLQLPVMDYEYAGVDEYREQYDALCDPFSLSYSPKLPAGLNFGRQLFWQRERFTQAFMASQYLLPYAQFWSWKLTGHAVAEVTSIGSHSDLWNPIAKRYSDFAERQGFAAMFPPLRRADDLLGPLRPEVRKITGISARCQVLVGIHDSNASLIPWLKTRETPFTVMSTGTWVIIFSLGAPLDSLNPERDCTANVNLHGEPIACARFMGGREFAAIAGDSPPPATVDDLATCLTENIMALPAFAEAGGPFPGQSGQIVSARELSASERSTLASIYCALVSDVSLDLCSAGGAIIVEGAFAKNPLLLQCLATLRAPQPILASSDSTGTTLGAAMLATDRIAAPDLAPIIPLAAPWGEKFLEYRHRWRQRLAAADQGRTTVSY